MDNIIALHNLSFKYTTNTIFTNFNLNIKRGSWTTIVGPNGSGKSTLMKLILGLIKADGVINVNDLILTESTLKEIRTIIGVVFENPDNQFVSETVSDELAFKLENLGYSKKDIKKIITEQSEIFEIHHLMGKAPHRLTGGEKQVVALVAAIVNNPRILILDEALTKIDGIKREKIYSLLHKLNESGLTIINITHDMEETILGDTVVVLNEGSLILNGPKEEVLLNEKIFNELGLELPFMASLSIKLKYYELIDHMIFDMNEMVNILWK